MFTELRHLRKGAKASTTIGKSYVFRFICCGDLGGSFFLYMTPNSIIRLTLAALMLESWAFRPDSLSMFVFITITGACILLLLSAEGNRKLIFSVRKFDFVKKTRLPYCRIQIVR